MGRPGDNLDERGGGDGPQTPEEREDELIGRNQDAEAGADAERLP